MRGFVLTALFCIGFAAFAAQAQETSGHQTGPGGFLGPVIEQKLPESEPLDAVQDDLPAASMHDEQAAEHETQEHAAGAKTEGHESGGLPQLNPQWFPSQIFWLLIAVAMLYAFFSQKTLPEIGKALQSREDHIRNNIETAQKLREKADQEKASWEKAQFQTQEKATNLFSKAEQDVRARTATVTEDLRIRSAKQIQDTEDYIARAKKEAMESIHTVAAEMASLAAKKIVGISTDIDQARTVVRNLNKKAA